MDIIKHKEEFDEAILRNNLRERAAEIAEYVLRKGDVSAKDFSELFGVSVKDAQTILSFIEKGIKFRK